MFLSSCYDLVLRRMTMILPRTRYKVDTFEEMKSPRMNTSKTPQVTFFYHILGENIVLREIANSYLLILANLTA